MVISRRFVDGLTVRSVVVGAVLTGEAWEDELSRVATRFNASLSSVPPVSPLVVEEEGRLVDCSRKDVCGVCPVIVNHVDYAAVLDLILNSNQKTFDGL